MTIQSWLSSLAYMMIQAVLFGIGILTIIMTPLLADAWVWIPVMIVGTGLLAIPLSKAAAARIRLSNPKTADHWLNQHPEKRHSMLVPSDV